MPMYCKTMSLKLGKVGKTWFYLENMFEVKMCKAQDKTSNLNPINVVIASRKAMFLHVILSLRKP
jgi:hypothetical protein